MVIWAHLTAKEATDEVYSEREGGRKEERREGGRIKKMGQNVKNLENLVKGVWCYLYYCCNFFLSLVLK